GKGDGQVREDGLEEGAVVVGRLDGVARGAELGDGVEVVLALAEHHREPEVLRLPRLEPERGRGRDRAPVAAGVRGSVPVYVPLAPERTGHGVARVRERRRVAAALVAYAALRQRRTVVPEPLKAVVHIHP